MVNSVVIWPTQEEPAVRPHKRRACGSTHPRPPHSAACAPLCIAPHHIASHHIASRRPVCQSVLREGHNWLCLPERSSAGRSTVTLSRTSGAPDSPLMNESEGRWCKSVCWRVFVRSIESRSRSSVPGFTGATSDFPGFLTLTTVLLRKWSGIRCKKATRSETRLLSARQWSAVVAWLYVPVWITCLAWRPASVGPQRNILRVRCEAMRVEVVWEFGLRWLPASGVNPLNLFICSRQSLLSVASILTAS